MIEHDPLGFIAVLAAMSAAVILCRLGGYWLIGRFTIRTRLRKILSALPGSIIASTIAPILFTGGVSAWAALIAAALTMAAVRNDFAALVAAVLIAAGGRAAGL
jgi:uncharacterized membrane protein